MESAGPLPRSGRAAAPWLSSPGWAENLEGERSGREQTGGLGDGLGAKPQYQGRFCPGRSGELVECLPGCPRGHSPGRPGNAGTVCRRSQWCVPSCWREPGVPGEQAECGVGTLQALLHSLPQVRGPQGSKGRAGQAAGPHATVQARDLGYRNSKEWHPCSTIPEPTTNGATRGAVPEGRDPVLGPTQTLGVCGVPGVPGAGDKVACQGWCL